MHQQIVRRIVFKTNIVGNTRRHRYSRYTCITDKRINLLALGQYKVKYLDKQYGYMVGMVNGKVKKIPLGKCAGKLKTVDPNAQEVLQAKRMGISFGD